MCHIWGLLGALESCQPATFGTSALFPSAHQSYHCSILVCAAVHGDLLLARDRLMFMQDRQSQCWRSVCCSMPCLSVMQVKRIDYYQRTDQALSQFLSGASAHSLSTDVTTYLHGDGLLTLRVARLPEGQELPGADTDQVWFWLRPRQVGGMALGSVTQSGTYAWMHKDPQQDFSSAAVPLTMRSSLQSVLTRPGGG